MPRIFKGSESTLRLLIHTCNQEGKISDLKIALYTNDPSVAIEFTDRYTIDGNIVSLTVPNYAFGTMEDGVVNYVAQGMIDDDTFLTERQSNYFLKTPANYTPTPMPEEVVLGELTTMIVENGVFEYTPSDVDAWNKATIEVNVPDTNGSYDEGYNVGKNDGYDSGYQDGYNQGQAECPEGGSCNLGEGSILLDTSMAGTYELYASDDDYDGWSKFVVYLENGGAIKVHKAEELIQMFNEGWGIDFGAYYYVGGKITEIQEINTQNGNATYVLDNGLKVYRGDWVDGNPFGEDQIKVGGYIVVYGIIQDYKGELQLKAHSQVIAYQECEGGEIVSCNLEDKWVTPSMSDRDDNGFIVVNQSEGYDGLDRVVIDPTTIYKEGVEEGRNQGGGSGDCNIQNQKRVDLNGEWEVYRPDEGYDGVYEVVVDASRKAEEWREEGRSDARNKLQSIEITENGRYSVDDSELVNYIEFDGNSYFDTNIPFGENTKIEVAITKTTYEEEEQFIGTANFDLFVAETYGGFGIVAGAGLAYGVFGRAKTHNIPFSYEEEQILTLDRNGLNSSLYDTRGWIDESGLVDDTVYGHTIGIGKINSSGDGWIYRGLNGRIRYVKIWTDGNDDSTLVTFIPKNMAQGGFGLVNSDGIEYTNISNLGEGTTTFISEWERKYGEGWKEINVNVDGEESIAANARVLNITENGVYVSKYTQDGDIVINSNQQITGVYDDGTNFYDTAELFCSYVQLDVIPTEETRIEFWYLPNKPHMGDGFHQIIQSTNDQIAFVFDGGGVDNKTLRFIFGDKSVSYTPSNIGDEWWHIIVDKNGLIFNGEEFPFDATATFKKAETNVYVNGSKLNSRKANGTFGMVKIGDTTYIPYEGGFLNTNTDVLQPIIQPNLGILEDGTPITKATYLNGAVFDTGLKITEDSTIELWINKYSRSESGYYLYSDLFSVRRDSSCWYVNTAKLNYADSYRNYFEHITISKAGGFVVEGESTTTMSLDSINFSSGEETIKIRTDNPKFAYGLLKINGNIIVPSEDGFTNITTNTPLRRCEEWGGTFEYKDAFSTYYANEITIQREGTLIRSVNVNVVPKIKVADEKFSFRTAQFTKIPEWADIDGIENMSNFFENCGQLTEIRWFDASRTTTMNHTFYNCGQLTHLPPLNTIRVTNMSEMLGGCGSLVSVAPLDARNLVRQSYGLFGYGNLNNLTDFGGLIGLKASMDGNYSFDKVPNLTYESCINILNGLYDFVGYGITPASNEGKLKVHSNFLTTVGDEISIGTAKGWTITA